MKLNNYIKNTYKDFIRYMYKKGYALPITININDTGDTYNFYDITSKENQIYVNFDYNDDNKGNNYILIGKSQQSKRELSNIILKLYSNCEEEFYDSDIVIITKVGIDIFSINLKYKDIKNGYTLDKGIHFNNEHIQIYVYDKNSNLKNIYKFELRILNVDVFSIRKRKL